MIKVRFTGKHFILFLVVISVAMTACTGCTDNNPTAQPLPTEQPAVSEQVKPPSAEQELQDLHDPQLQAVWSFQGGRDMSEGDTDWFIGVRKGTDLRDLNLYMRHDFFDLPGEKQSRLSQVYLDEWRSSLKESGVPISDKLDKDNSKIKINYYYVSEPLSDSKFIKSVTNN